ncbi:MAG: carotenoid biosynthesis protein [Deltaproteobacteria bacterium]|nr:carotenoid biosynthesis protein [Deltaproteobacteria bacterium]
MKENSPATVFMSSDKEFDKKFAFVAYGLLILIILFSTYLHYYQPQVLNVPSNVDVSTWKNPSFEHTCIYGRMTEAEKAKIRSEGIPGNTIPEILFMEIFALFVAWLCFSHARKHYGIWMASCFLIGSFVFTGLQESAWILFGRFTGRSAMQGLGEAVYGTYWFTKGGLWFIETPVSVCLGWFYLAYSCVWIAGKAFTKKSLLWRAAVGGLIAMGLDLWTDPVVTSPELMSWVWATGDFIRVLGIPQTNFVGWFLLIFCFAFLWEWLPGWEEKWGRAKATNNFFLILVGMDIVVLVFQVPWCFILRSILVLAGVDHGLLIPQGW